MKQNHKRVLNAKIFVNSSWGYNSTSIITGAIIVSGSRTKLCVGLCMSGRDKWVIEDKSNAWQEILICFFICILDNNKLYCFASSTRHYTVLFNCTCVALIHTNRDMLKHEKRKMYPKFYIWQHEVRKAVLTLPRAINDKLWGTLV